MASDYSKAYGLHPGWFSANKRWAVDQDYLARLKPAELAWLDRFNREYHGGDIRKGDPQALHNTDDLRRDCYRRNNNQNRDLLSIKAVVGKILPDLKLVGEAFGEDETLTLIDRRRRPRNVDMIGAALRFAASYLLAIRSLT